MRGSPVARYEKSSYERIASMSVTKEKRNTVSILGRAAATEYRETNEMPGAQQPQAYGNGEIVTAICCDRFQANPPITIIPAR